jgi:ribosomal protein L37E
MMARGERGVTEREGVERCIAALTRHARLDSTGDETKAAMHIVVNWLQRTLDSAQRDTRHRYQPNRKYPWFCAECGYPEHERLKHAVNEQEATTDAAE